MKEQELAKTVWQCDPDGFLLGPIVLSKKAGDWGKSGWLVPARCIEVKPPKMTDGFRLRWIQNQWEPELISVEPGEELSFEYNRRQRLNREFQSRKRDLMESFFSAQMSGDETLQKEIQAEFAEMKQEYEEMSILLEHGVNLWEKEMSND